MPFSEVRMSVYCGHGVYNDDDLRASLRCTVPTVQTLTENEDETAFVVPLLLAKAQCRVPADVDDEDGLIALNLNAAETLINETTEFSLRESTWELALNRLPAIRRSSGLIEIRLEISPVNRINFVKYIGTDGAEHELDSELYQFVPGHPDRVTIDPASLPADASRWGSAPRRLDAWKVNFRAGAIAETEDEEATDVPATAKLAVLMLAEAWFRDRESVGKIPEEGPAKGLIDSLRWRT